MSNKRSRYKRQNKAVPANDKKDVLKAERGLFASDGFTNTLAYIGQASTLMQAGTYVRNGITGNMELLTTLYRENWIAKRIIDVPAEDMTRSWYTLESQLQGDKIDELRKLEEKHNIKGQLCNAIKWSRLYGGAAALIVIEGQEDMLDEPLDMDMLQPGCFRGLMIIDRYMGLSPSLDIEEDMDDVDFGYPKYYDITIDNMDTQIVRVHHSRLIPFRGRELPHYEEQHEDYWGASELEHIYEELQKRNTTSANIAQLIFQANVRTLKMSDFGEILAMGTASQKRKVLESIQEQNRLVNNFGLQVLSAEDGFQNHPYSFGGIADVYEKFMADMAGAAQMPATKLYGRSPDGMNSTGDSDMNMYYESISQKQERILKPALERLLPVMCISLWGKVPDDYEITFNPIATVTAADKASIGSQMTGNVVQAFNAGLIGRKTALLELRNNGKELGIWQKITDETIDEADDSVDQGEGQGGMQGMQGMGGQGADPNNPMAAMMGGGAPGGGAPDDAGGGQNPMAAMMGGAPQGKPQGKPQNAPKQAQEAPGQALPQDLKKQKPQSARANKGNSGANIDSATLQKLKSLIEQEYGKTEEGTQDNVDMGQLAKLIQEYAAEQKNKQTEDAQPVQDEAQLQKNGDHVQIVVRTNDKEPKKSFLQRLFRR